MKTTLNDLVEQLVRQNPELAKNPMYLVLETWSKQGLELYPHQRELLLSKTLAGAEAVGRAGRRARIKIQKENEKKRQRVAANERANTRYTKAVHIKVLQS